MSRAGTTLVLVVVVAASSALRGIAMTAQATAAPFPWAPTLIALLPHVTAVAAAVLVWQASAWWRRASLAYVAAFTALEAVGLVQIVPFASQFDTGMLLWSLATSSLALVTAVLAVVLLRDVSTGGDGSGCGPFRWVAVAAGLLLVASSMFAWSVSEPAPSGGWTFTLGHASVGVLVGSVVGMAVVAGLTAVVAASSDHALVVGTTVGLLVSRPVALGIFADRTWQDANAMLAAGWWLALVAQALLVMALVGLLNRRADNSHTARDLAPTV